MIPISIPKCRVKTQEQDKSVILKCSLTLYSSGRCGQLCVNKTRCVHAIWSISSLKSECDAIAFSFFCVSMLCYSQPLSLTKASVSHPPQCSSTGNYHFYFIKANAYSVWNFFFLKRGMKIIIMYLHLLFLTPPQNHSVQTTSRPTLSGKSRFRKKGNTIDSTTCKKENIKSPSDILWDVAGCWLTLQL